MHDRLASGRAVAATSVASGARGAAWKIEARERLAVQAAPGFL